jgi:hypothetical protein
MLPSPRVIGLLKRVALLPEPAKNNTLPFGQQPA